MNTYAYGHDFGNAETCGVMSYHGKWISACIPSATAQGRLDDLTNLGVPLGDHGFVYRDNSTELYVGELAYSQALLSSTSRNDINRYWNRKSLHLLLTVATSMIDDEEFALNVVTGLPVETYKGDGENRAMVKQTLEGDHHFLINGRKRRIQIRVERVIMEGAGAIIAYGSKEKVMQGVIDIGGRTTDLFAANGQLPVVPRCAGKQLGVELAGDTLSKNFFRRYKRELTNEERRLILYAHVSKGKKPYPRIFAGGKEVTNLRALTEEALLRVGDDITSAISATWNESETGQVASSFAHVLLVGGGAYYFQEQIQALIPHVQIVPSPEEANALGYAAFADGQLRKLHIA